MKVDVSTITGVLLSDGIWRDVIDGFEIGPLELAGTTLSHEAGIGFTCRTSDPMRSNHFWDISGLVSSILAVRTS